MTDEPYDDEYEYDLPEDDCWHEDCDVDILTGRASCNMCDHRWWMTDDEFDAWQKLQADWENNYYDLLVDEARS